MKPSPPLVDTGHNIAQIWGQWRRRLSRSNQSSRSLAQGMDEVKSKRSRPARSCRLQKDCLFQGLEEKTRRKVQLLKCKLYSNLAIMQAVDPNSCLYLSPSLSLPCSLRHQLVLADLSKSSSTNPEDVSYMCHVIDTFRCPPPRLTIRRWTCRTSASDGEGSCVVPLHRRGWAFLLLVLRRGSQCLIAQQASASPWLVVWLGGLDVGG